MEDEYLKNIEDGEEIDFVISVLEDNIKGIEIES